MNTKHTPGTWKITIDDRIETSYFTNIKGEKVDNFDDASYCSTLTICKIETGYLRNVMNEEERANAKLIAAAPELLQMVYNLKKCIERLTGDNILSQEDKDKEAQWVGEAHELLYSVNPDYYKNANSY